MEQHFDTLSFETRSELINSAFAHSKPSPYTSLPRMCDFSSFSTPYSKQSSTLEEFYSIATGRSSISGADSIETTHDDNINDFSWSNMVDLNTPKQSSHMYGAEDEIKLLKVIKNIFTQNILDVFRSYVDEIFVKDLKTMIVQYETGKIVLDIDAFRVRVFAIIRKCLASKADANIVRIYEALREKYDVELIEEIPSFGSITHSNGYCKPCVFANKTVNSCKNGTECNFCHFQHKITRRKGAAKENAEMQKQDKNTIPKNTEN